MKTTISMFLREWREVKYMMCFFFQFKWVQRDQDRSMISWCWNLLHRHTSGEWRHHVPKFHSTHFASSNLTTWLLRSKISCPSLQVSLGSTTCTFFLYIQLPFKLIPTLSLFPIRCLRLHQKGHTSAQGNNKRQYDEWVKMWNHYRELKVQFCLFFSNTKHVYVHSMKIIS